METANLNDIIAKTESLLERARSNFQRECIILSGNHEWCINTVEQLNQSFDLSHSIVVSSNSLTISFSTSVATEKALHYLGHEFNHAIINCYDGFDPNVFGAISGTVRGGGLLLLLVPEIEKLSEFDDPENNRMTIWPYDAGDVHKRFLARFGNILRHSKSINIFTAHSTRTCENIHETSSKELENYLKNDRCITGEQRQAVESIVHVVDGHRRRPLVITADRGRGKSSALGIAAADLLRRGGQQIIATGPRFSATEKIFEHASTQLMNTVKKHEIIYKDSFIRYMSVDAILDEKPDCSLLIVDEAATIPVNLLTQLLTRYSRIVFSTTTYGYEGTGRGFNLRFFDILNRTVPGWKHCEIKAPIRWAPQDPVEEFISELLCLNADVAKISPDVNFSQVEFTAVDRDDLIKNQSLLSSVFGLLILAHYRTQPRDLRYLLDSLDLSIFVARYKDTILGTAIVELEGGLDPSIAQQIYKNERRVQGHLLPQSMESTIGIKNASQLRYLRIIRIITHPHCQRQGIGTKLMDTLESFARKNNIDLIGANFGINNEVLPFWTAAGFCPVHVGLTANTSTGTHSISVLKSTSSEGDQLLKKAHTLFNNKFGFLLATTYNDLDTNLVDFLYSAHTANKQDRQMLDEQLIEDVVRFANSSSDYDMAAQSLNRFVQHCFYYQNVRDSLEDIEKTLLIRKVLQQQSWPAVITALKLDGRSQAVLKLRDIIKKLEKLLL